MNIRKWARKHVPLYARIDKPEPKIYTCKGCGLKSVRQNPIHHQIGTIRKLDGLYKLFCDGLEEKA